MSSFWGLPAVVLGGSLLNANRHYEILFFKEPPEVSPTVVHEGAEEEGEIGEETEESIASSDEDENVQEKPAKITTTSQPIIVKTVIQKVPASISTTATSKPVPTSKLIKMEVDDEEEEGAVSSGSETTESGEMESSDESDAEMRRKKKAEQEVRAEIMARGAKMAQTSSGESKIKKEQQSEPAKPKPEKRKMDADLPQMKELKKPMKQLKCYSEKDVDYRAMWKEQLDALKAPPNHPFFQLSVRNVRTKAYCDLWESEEKKDYLYYKPGTWDHVKDVPRLSEDNLSKLSIAEAKQFVTWLLAERKIGNSELLSLRRRFWAESDRHRRLKAYITGQRKLPESASAVKASQAASNNPTIINSEGLLVVAPKEQKRLLQGISKLWMTEQTSNLLKQKQRVYAKMKKRGTEFFKNKFKELDRLCRAEVKKAKQQWETYMMDCMRQNGIIVGSILEECVERVATGNIPPDPRVMMAQQRRFWQAQRGGRGRGGPSWGRGGFRTQRGKSRADQLQL